MIFKVTPNPKHFMILWKIHKHLIFCLHCELKQFSSWKFGICTWSSSSVSAKVTLQHQRQVVKWHCSKAVCLLYIHWIYKRDFLSHYIFSKGPVHQGHLDCTFCLDSGNVRKLVKLSTVFFWWYLEELNGLFADLHEYSPQYQPISQPIKPKKLVPKIVLDLEQVAAPFLKTKSYLFCYTCEQFVQLI